MYCLNCGSPLPDTARFCAKCGTAVSTAAPAAPGPPSVPSSATGYPPPGYGAPAPYPAYAPMPVGTGTPAYGVAGLVFTVLGIIASLVATGLSIDEAYAWAAGIFFVALLLFVIAGVCYSYGRRRM